MANVVPFFFKGELMHQERIIFLLAEMAFKIALYTSNPYTTSSTVKACNY